jgi:hypothetical protein
MAVLEVCGNVVYTKLLIVTMMVSIQEHHLKLCTYLKGDFLSW